MNSFTSLIKYNAIDRSRTSNVQQSSLKLMIFGITPCRIAEQFITDLIDLPEKTVLEGFEGRMVQHIDMVVLVIFTELVSRCFCIDS